jgi:tetratricopeptide (TPR) repeat protein/S1-C subfamily serine protease
MEKSFYIALITSSSLLFIPAACNQSQTTNHNQSALAAGEKSTESIQQTASAIAVKISVGSSSGSGILIAQAGNTYTVVTNAHVIGRGNNYQITTLDGKTHQGTLKKSEQSDNQDDLALLQFQATEKYTLASLGDVQKVTPGQSVFAVGFGDGEEQLTFNSGKIEQISQKPLVGGYQIGFTNTTKQGMSGGALLDEEGKVIGILGLGAGAILDNAYLYADNSRPDAQMLEQLRANSFAVPVTQIASSIASKQEEETQETDSKIAPSKKYTGLPGEIDSIAQQITVRIDSQNNGNGSGVIVAQNGDTYYVATAGHVVKNKDDYTIVAPDGQSYPIESSTIKTFEGIDLAVVQFQSQEAYTVATLGKYDLNYNINRESRWVFVSGFPGQKMETEEQSSSLLTAGVVQPKYNANFYAKDSYSLTDGYGLLYTNQSFPGMSGGAVLDSQSRVVGINAGAEDEVVVGKTGNVAEVSLGLSLAVPIGTLVRFVKSAKIKPEWLKQETSEPSEPDKLDLASIRKQMFDAKAPSSNATEVSWLNYGNQLWRFRQYDQAIAAFERAIQLNPNSHYAYYGKGWVSEIQGKYRQAKNVYQQATKLAPDFYPAWDRMGAVLGFDGLKQYPKAIKAYNQAIQLQPSSFAPYVRRGITFYQLKSYQEAIADFNKAIEIHPHFFAYLNRGLVYSEQDQADQALADYDKAIALNPKYALTYNNRGLIYYKQGKINLALADYNHAIKLDANLPFAYNNRSDIYFKQGKTDLALADYDRAIKLDPNSADAYVGRGWVYYQQGKIDLALADYNQAIKLDPKYALTYNNRGLIYYEQGKIDEALADYNQAIKLDAKLPFAYNNRGLIYYEQGKIDEALADYNQAIKLDAKLPFAYNNRGLIYYDSKEYLAAITNYDKAVEINPKYTDAYNNRGNVYLALKEYQAAIVDYNKSIEINPNYAHSYRNLGLVLARLEKYKAAIVNYKKAAQLFQKQGNTERYQQVQQVLKELEGI